MEDRFMLIFTKYGGHESDTWFAGPYTRPEVRIALEAEIHDLNNPNSYLYGDDWMPGVRIYDDGDYVVSVDPYDDPYVVMVIEDPTDYYGRPTGIPIDRIDGPYGTREEAVAHALEIKEQWEFSRGGDWFENHGSWHNDSVSAIEIRRLNTEWNDDFVVQQQPRG